MPTSEVVRTPSLVPPRLPLSVCRPILIPTNLSLMSPVIIVGGWGHLGSELRQRRRCSMQSACTVQALPGAKCLHFLLESASTVGALSQRGAQESAFTVNAHSRGPMHHITCSHCESTFTTRVLLGWPHNFDKIKIQRRVPTATK